MEVGILLLIAFILICPLSMMWMRRRHGRSHDANHPSVKPESPADKPLERRSDRDRQ